MNGEVALISLLLNSKDPEKVWAEINETAGYKNLFLGHKEEFDFIKEFRGKFNKFPSPDSFKKKFPAVVLGKPSESIKYYLEEMGDKFIYEGLAKINDRLVDGLSNEKPVDVLAKLSKDLNAFQNIRRTKLDHNYSDQVSRDLRVKKYESRGKLSPINGIPTGWSPLDLETFGFQNEELIFLVARQGSYKTWSLISWALNAWKKGFSPMFFSKEMGASAISRRMDALLTGVAFKELRLGLKGIELDRFNKTLTKQSKGLGPFHIVDSSGVSGFAPDFIWEKVKQYKPDVVFIDGVYLLGGKGQSMWEAQTSVTRALKDITLSEFVPIVGTNQANRAAAGKNKKIGTENMAYSDSYGQDADAVIAQNRIYDKDNQRWANKVLVELIKHREGDSVSFVVSYDLKKMEILVEDVDVYDSGGGLTVSISEEDDVGEELLI